MFGRKRYSNVKISNLKSHFKGRCAFSSSSPAPVSPPTLSSLQPSPTPELLSQSSEGWCKIILVQLFLVQHNYFANCSYKTQNISKIWKSQVRSELLVHNPQPLLRRAFPHGCSRRRHGLHRRRLQVLPHLHRLHRQGHQHENHPHLHCLWNPDHQAKHHPPPYHHNNHHHHPQAGHHVGALHPPSWPPLPDLLWHICSPLRSTINNHHQGQQYFITIIATDLHQPMSNISRAACASPAWDFGQVKNISHASWTHCGSPGLIINHVGETQIGFRVLLDLYFKIVSFQEPSRNPSGWRTAAGRFWSALRKHLFRCVFLGVVATAMGRGRRRKGRRKSCSS